MTNNGHPTSGTAVLRSHDREIGTVEFKLPGATGAIWGSPWVISDAFVAQAVTMQPTGWPDRIPIVVQSETGTGEGVINRR